jgi:hypothetical protein
MGNKYIAKYFKEMHSKIGTHNFSHRKLAQLINDIKGWGLRGSAHMIP